jgi:hypothetical protein
MAAVKRTLAGRKRPSGRGGGLPPQRVRTAICNWINGQFETASPAQLPNPPTIRDCAVWTCTPDTDLVGVTYLTGRTVYYSSSNGVNNTGWWRIGVVPKSVMP